MLLADGDRSVSSDRLAISRATAEPVVARYVAVVRGVPGAKRDRNPNVFRGETSRWTTMTDERTTGAETEREWTAAQVRERAESYFGDVAPAHDWHHVRRVARLAETLAGKTDREVDERVLLAAAWLHDVGRAREDRGEIADHAEWGAREAGRILADLGADPDAVSAAKHCVRAHRYSNDVEPETPEAELLCDADNLDALGAVGIARCFCYGGERGQPLHDPDLPVEADDTEAGATQLNHVQKKVLSLHERMYTDAGREMAEDRRAYVAEFVERFEREVAGDA